MYNFADYAALETELINLLRNANKAITLAQEEQSAATALLATQPGIVAALDKAADDKKVSEVIAARASVAGAAARKSELLAKLNAAVADRQDAMDALKADVSDDAETASLKARLAKFESLKTELENKLK